MTENTRRIYGADHDDPDPYILQPGHDYVELVGGPLAGQLLDVTALAADERAGGALLIAPRSAFGPGGRVGYEPRPGTTGRWDWSGGAPW